MPKRILQGTVTSDQNAQTVTVQVVRRYKHPLLQKTIKKSKKYRAHDADNKFKVGDTVQRGGCRDVELRHHQRLGAEGGDRRTEGIVEGTLGGLREVAGRAGAVHGTALGKGGGADPGGKGGERHIASDELAVHDPVVLLQLIVFAGPTRLAWQGLAMTDRRCGVLGWNLLRGS